MATWRSSNGLREDAAFQAPLRELREEALDWRLSQEQEVGTKLEGEALVAARARRAPWTCLQGPRSCHRITWTPLPGRDIGLDGVEEADELLVAVALHAAPERTLPSSQR